MGKSATNGHTNNLSDRGALTPFCGATHILEGVVIRPSLSTLPYLLTLTTGIIASQFLDYLNRSNPWIYGQSPGTLIMLGATALATALWLFTAPPGRMTGLPLWIFSGLLGLWALVLVSARLDQAAFTYAALATPIALLLVISKPPGPRDAWRLADLSFGLIALLSIAAQLLDWIGLRSSRTSIYSRWSIPFTDWDLGYRWEGFFGDPNNAGLIGAVLLIYGLHRRGWLRVGFVFTGILIVIFAESRTAMLAIAAGLLATILTSHKYRALNVRPLITLLGTLTVSALGIVLIFLLDPTLNGRTQIWEAYLSLWRESPLIGVGSSGVDAAVSRGDIPWDTIDGHSVLIDALARHGIFVGLLILAILIAMLVLTGKLARLDSGVSLSLVVVWLFGALTYTLTPWLYLNTLTLPAIIALLLAQAQHASDPVSPR